MEFGIEKCAMLVMKSGNRHLTDGMELPNQGKIKTLTENETYKYLGILEADTIKQVYHSLDIPDPFSSGPETNLNKWINEQEN